MKMSLDDIRERLEGLERKAKEHEKRISSLESTRTESETTLEKPLSLPEFLRGKDLNYHKDKFLHIGYYLERYQDRDAFTTSDVEDGYSTCIFEKAANPSDIIAKAAAEGLFMEKGEEKGVKKWVLTETGERIVEEGIEND